ncbi:MAG: FAD binding domain-containing protein [Acidimicrobiales bacterium]
MKQVREYFRPASLDEALSLLDRADAVAIGGGTTRAGSVQTGPCDVVDLQGLGLGSIDIAANGDLAIGATVSLQQLADSESVPPVVREAARRDLPSTLRSQATIGGVIVCGDFESELLATLLAYDAVVSVRGHGGTDEMGLADFLGTLPFESVQLVTKVSIASGGRSAAFRTARTTADRSIVAAVARVAPDGTRRLALAGVASRPLLVERVEELDPPSDFRGSSEYRKELASVLAARATKEVS